MPTSPKHNIFQIISRLFWRSMVRCFEDNTPMIAAAVSFYAILSLTPALWIILTAAGAFVGTESARARVLQWSAELMGTQAAAFVDLAMDHAQEATPLSTIIGIVWLLFGATLAFGALYDGLNVIWRAAPPPDRSMLRSFLTKRGLAFLIVVFIGFLVLSTLTISAVLSAIADVVPAELPAPHILLQAGNLLFSLVLVTLMIASVFHILHDAAIEPANLWIGAIVTALLFEAGKLLIAIYLSHAPLTSFYGAAGSLAALMLWIYYSVQIILFGAAFTEQYAHLTRLAHHSPENAGSPAIR